MADLRVAAIVVNCGTPAPAIACVESLLKSDGIDPHVFVIDNKSPDDSVERLNAAFIDNPSVTVVARKKNDGRTGGNNAGFALARKLLARYAVVLRSDTAVHSDCLRLLVEEAERTGGAAIVSPRILFGALGDRLWFGGGRFSLWRGRPVHVGFGRDAEAGLRENSDIGFATSCAMLIRLDAPGVRDFDRSLFSYAEDLELSLSVLQAGARIRYVPQAVATQVEGAGRGKAGGEPQNWYLETRDLLRVDARYARWYHWITLGPMVALDAIGRFAFRTRA